MGGMGIRRVVWATSRETRELALRFICALPGSIGHWVRSRTLPRYFAKIGVNTVIQERLRVTNPEKISIGSNCNFATGVFMTGGGGITLGDYVGLGPDVKIWSVNHRYEDPDTPWLLQGYEHHPVHIEDDVWLGASCFVMPGTTIGRGAIISAGTVLMKSVPPYAIVAGNPGRVVGWRRRAQVEEEPSKNAAHS